MNTVAELAGVSLGTVSNVLNQPGRVAPATAQKVLEAIESLGYIRNAAARDLKRSVSEGVGLIVPDIVNRLFVDIARGAQIAAARVKLKLLMANAVYQFETFQPAAVSHHQDEYLDYFAEQRMRGILYATMSDPTDGIHRIRDHVRPIVVINYDQPGDWCSVLMDNEQAGRLACEHLAALGIRDIYYLSPPDVAQPLADRRHGIHESAPRLGVTLTELTTESLRAEAGESAAATILTEERMTGRLAIVAASDDIAIGVLNFVRNHTTLRVPDDIAVMGLDGTHTAMKADWVGLTSIVTPGYRMGEEAIRLVTAESQPVHHHERIILPVTVRDGASTLGVSAHGADR